MTSVKNTILRNKLSLSLFLIVFTAAICVVFYKFNQIPRFLTRDEVEYGLVINFINHNPLTPYTPVATGHATLYFYIINIFFALFGVSNQILRLPSAVFSILSAVVFYLTLRLIFKNQLIAFLGGLSFVFLRWYFNFARFSFEVTFLLFLELVSTYCFFLYYQKSSPLKTKLLAIFFSGLFAGLAFNSYLPGRIFFVLPLFFLGLDFTVSLFRKRNIRACGKSLLYFLIPLIVSITPLLLHVTTHLDVRVQQQSYFDNKGLTVNEKIEFLKESTFLNLQMFYGKGDINARHNYPGKPAINLITLILFIIGLLIGLRFIYKRENQYFLLFLIFGFVPTILTYPWENPNMLRTYTMIPALIYFITVALSIIYSLLNKKIDKKIIFALLFSVVVMSAIVDLRSYFVHQVLNMDEAFESRDKIQMIIQK